MFDLNLLDEELPIDLKLNSGRKKKEVDNRYKSFFIRYIDYQLPPFIEDLIYGAARASTPANEFIKPSLIRRCFTSFDTFSVENIQSLFPFTMSSTYLKNIIIACEGMQNRLDHHLPNLTEEQLKAVRPELEF